MSRLETKKSQTVFRKKISHEFFWINGQTLKEKKCAREDRERERVRVRERMRERVREIRDWKENLKEIEVRLR